MASRRTNSLYSEFKKQFSSSFKQSESNFSKHVLLYAPENWNWILAQTQSLSLLKQTCNHWSQKYYLNSLSQQSNSLLQWGYTDLQWLKAWPTVFYLIHVSISTASISGGFVCTKHQSPSLSGFLPNAESANNQPRTVPAVQAPRCDNALLSQELPQTLNLAAPYWQVCL